MNKTTIVDILMSLSLMIGIYAVGKILIDTIDSYVNWATYNVPTLWTVNVNRFIILQFGLVTGGMLIGAMVIYFTARVQLINKRRKSVIKALKPIEAE